MTTSPPLAIFAALSSSISQSLSSISQSCAFNVGERFEAKQSTYPQIVFSRVDSRYDAAKQASGRTSRTLMTKVNHYRAKIFSTSDDQLYYLEDLVTAAIYNNFHGIYEMDTTDYNDKIHTSHYSSEVNFSIGSPVMDADWTTARIASCSFELPTGSFGDGYLNAVETT